MANTTLKFGNGEWYGKEDTILAYNDENKNFKPLPFDFERGSTATRINKEGLIETVGANEPRIDYKDDSKGALLLEPSRTNVNKKSENIQNWSFASNASGEYGYEDPFKGNKAVKLTSTNDAQAYQAYQSSSILSSGTTYTYSIYAKRGTGYKLLIDFAIPSNGSVIVDLRDGSLISESGIGYITYNVEELSNGWYRISMVSTFNSSAYFRTGLYQQQGDCYVAFAQIEAGSYATSYIPTQGTVQTRLADTCTNGANEQVIKSTEGVLYYEASYIDGSDYNSVSLSNNSGSEKLRTWYDNTNLVFANFVNNVNQTFIAYPISKNINYKIAVRYKLNDFALYVNGNKATNIVVNLGGVSPQNSYNKLNLNSGDIYNKLYGNVKDVKLYNTALTDSELQALTQV